MTDDRITLLVGEIESRYPGTRVELRPTSDEEDPAIRAFLWILEVPVERLCEVEDLAIDRALDLYGDDPLPFHVTAASPETTAKYFPAPAFSIFADYLSQTVWLPQPVRSGISRSLTAWNLLLRHTWENARIQLAPGLWLAPPLPSWSSYPSPLLLDSALAWEGTPTRGRETPVDPWDLRLAA